MSGRARGRLLASCMAVAATSAWACGICIEDKMALTYEHAIAQHAFARGQVIVFCEVSGTDAIHFTAIADRARQLPGVQHATVRASAQPMTLSFALDPNIQTPGTAVDALRKTLPAAATITLLNVMTGNRAAKK